MRLKERQQREWDTRSRKYVLYRRRRRTAFSIVVFLLLAVMVALYILGAHLSANSPEATTSVAPSESSDTSAADQAAPEDTVAEEAPPEETTAETSTQDEASKAPPIPDDPTLYLTVPRLGLYGNTVRNDRSEASLDLGAIKLPNTGFPWEQGANTYMACHRLGWPGTESYNQCLNLPLMQKGDPIYLADTNGTVYKYLVSDIKVVSPNDSWVANPPDDGKTMLSLQTCVENAGDFWTLGPNWFARFVVQAEQV